MKPSRDYTKALKGQRESRVQSRDPRGRESRLDASALARALGMFRVKLRKAST
jgi:hypothetical protein